jgi:hypothetical protein
MNKNLQLTLSLLLLCGLVQAQIVNLGGTITVQSGATLVVEGNVSNLSTGTINNEGTIEIKGNLLNEASSLLVGTDGTYLFSGTDAATITSNGAAIQNLTIDKAGANVTLVDPLTVNGILAFGNAGTGKLVLGGQSLTLGTGSSIVDADANGYIVAVGAGSVVKNMSAPTGFTFEVGDATNYSPITFANNAGAGAGSVSARVVTVAHPNKPGTSNDFITRYWPVVTSYPSTFTGTYVDGDITGTEANIKGASFNELAVLNQAGSAGNDAQNTVTVNTIAGSHDVTGFAALIREFMLKAILQGPYNAMTDVMSTNLKILGISSNSKSL